MPGYILPHCIALLRGKAARVLVVVGKELHLLAPESLPASYRLSENHRQYLWPSDGLMLTPFTAGQRFTVNAANDRKSNAKNFCRLLSSGIPRLIGNR